MFHIVRGPCGCHWAVVLGPHGRRCMAALCIGVVSMGGRRREECTRVIVVLQGLWVGVVIVTQWPCGCVVVVAWHCDCMKATQRFWACVDFIVRGQCARLVGTDLCPHHHAGALGTRGHCSMALNECCRCCTGVLSPCGRRVGALYVHGHRLAVSLCACGCRHTGAQGPCNRHHAVVISQGLGAHVVIVLWRLGACAVIAMRVFCTHVIVVVQGSVAVLSPCGSSVEPMRNDDNVGSVPASSPSCRGSRPESMSCCLGPTSLLLAGALDQCPCCCAPVLWPCCCRAVVLCMRSCHAVSLGTFNNHCTVVLWLWRQRVYCGTLAQRRQGLCAYIVVVGQGLKTQVVVVGAVCPSSSRRALCVWPSSAAVLSPHGRHCVVAL